MAHLNADAAADINIVQRNRRERKAAVQVPEAVASAQCSELYSVIECISAASLENAKSFDSIICRLDA